MASLDRLTLVINASYEAVNIVTARRAMTLVCKGAAVVEKVSSEKVRTASMELPVPSVIRLVRYKRVPRPNRSVSRRNILLRDRNICQYCGQFFASSELTLDHVIPRSRGGGSTWENYVTCCFPCNNRKGDRTPEECGMPLLRKPIRLSIHAKHRFLAGDEKAWDPYLFA